MPADGLAARSRDFGTSRLKEQLAAKVTPAPAAHPARRAAAAGQRPAPIGACASACPGEVDCRFADKDMRQWMPLEHVPIPQERDML